MINKKSVIVGGKYGHDDKFQTEYIVDKIIIDATGEEKTGKLGRTVIYTQTKAVIYPMGTQYARSYEDFLNNFELIE